MNKGGTLDFDKGPKYLSFHPPILKLCVEAPGNFLIISLSSLLSPEFHMDLVQYIHHYIKSWYIIVFQYFTNKNTMIFFRVLETKRNVWQLKRESFKVTRKVDFCEVSFSLNVRISKCSQK